MQVGVCDFCHLTVLSYFSLICLLILRSPYAGVLTVAFHVPGSGTIGATVLA